MTDDTPDAATRMSTPDVVKPGLDVIELRLGAVLEHLPIIRSLAASIAMRADFDLDAIADFKLAVDEACSTVITRAMYGTTLVCRFTLSKEEIRFTTVTRSTNNAEPDLDSFGWRVLTTLTDHATSWIEQDNGAGNGGVHLIHIELAKRKTDGIL